MTSDCLSVKSNLSVGVNVFVGGSVLAQPWEDQSSAIWRFKQACTSFHLFIHFCIYLMAGFEAQA